MKEKLDENFVKSLVVIAQGIAKGSCDPYDLVNGAMEYLIKNKEKYMDHPNLKALAVLKMKGLFIDDIRKSKNFTSLTDDEGKEMEISDEQQLKNPEIGSMVVFPAYILHSVLPVTKNVRYALVGWVHGPSFR